MAGPFSIDPESAGPLGEHLARFPGGINRIPDLARRRAVDEQLSLEWARASPPSDAVVTGDLAVAGPAGDPDVRVRVYRPADADSSMLAGVLFIHGGGMIMGSLASEDHIAEMLCQELGAIVVSVGYRLAPESPYPAGLSDCYAALVWMHDDARLLGLDPDRLAVYGASAGGGLALGCALLARDRGGPRLRLCMSIYPMVDDTSSTPSSHEVTDVGVWDRPDGLEAWELYLDGHPADGYAAPARAEDLSGLPPVFIDVGDVDLFRDEDLALAGRLLTSGVRTELHVYPGAYHASELFAPDAALSRRIWDARLRALREALAKG